MKSLVVSMYPWYRVMKMACYFIGLALQNPPDQTNEEDIGSLPEKEFRVMIVKMIQNLGNRMEKNTRKF